MSSQGQAKLKRARLARLTRAAGAETGKAVIARQVQGRIINYDVAVMEFFFYAKCLLMLSFFIFIINEVYGLWSSMVSVVTLISVC